jgi:arsenate reductase
VAPLTKNTAAIAAAAARGETDRRSALWSRLMADVTIYHNPRCTKSRQAMQVVEELGVEVDVVRYLDDPPDEATLREIVDKLEDDHADLVRREKWSELGVTADDLATDDGIIDTLVAHPELLQRPLLVTDEMAIIGRPTERVRELLQD